MTDYKEEYTKMVKIYKRLHDKLYKPDFFEIEPAAEFTSDSRQFKNGLCICNNRLGIAYSVTDIVETLNSLISKHNLIIQLLDEKIEYLEESVDMVENSTVEYDRIMAKIEVLNKLQKEINEVLTFC